MIHAVRIKDGKASYANRYVHTKKLETERRFGHSMYLKVRAWKAIYIALPAPPTTRAYFRDALALCRLRVVPSC